MFLLCLLKELLILTIFSILNGNKKNLEIAENQSVISSSVFFLLRSRKTNICVNSGVNHCSRNIKRSTNLLVVIYSSFLFVVSGKN